MIANCLCPNCGEYIEGLFDPSDCPKVEAMSSKSELDEKYEAIKSGQNFNSYGEQIIAMLLFEILQQLKARDNSDD